MNNHFFKYAIALTGGIATGKSTVCKLLELQNFDIIDADKIAHKLLDENSEKIASMFGKEFIEDGKVLRKKLGKIIFSNEKEKKRLESLIHPLIKEEIYKESETFEKLEKPYFIDIPLFFENMHYPIPKSLLVYTPKNLQIQRLMNRDNINEDEAKLKISNQLDIEKKREMADLVIDNTSDLENLQKEVKKIIEDIKYDK